MNNRQHQFLEKIARFSNAFNELYNDSFYLSESFKEEFDTDAENSLDPTNGIVTEEELTERGIDYADIKNSMNFAANTLVLMYTNQDVITKEYGKFIRRIMTIK